MVLAKCGQLRILHLCGWMPRKCRRVLEEWRILVMHRHLEFRKLKFVRLKFVVALGYTKRASFSAWHHVCTTARSKASQSKTLRRRIGCRKVRFCFHRWGQEVVARDGLFDACTHFLHAFLCRCFQRCLRAWHGHVYERVRKRCTKAKLDSRRLRSLLHGSLRRWALSLSLDIDAAVLKLLQSSSCPVPVRLTLAKNRGMTWRRLSRGPDRQPMYRTLRIGRRYLEAVVQGMWCRRLLLLLRSWRLLLQLRACARHRAKQCAWGWWQEWRQRMLSKACLQRTGSLVARRTVMFLLYLVLAHWYLLLKSRFQKILSQGKNTFDAWVQATKHEAAARQSKGQALWWVSQRSLVLRTLLLWVFRGSRARSLHVARRWLSRAFHRWSSSTFRGRSSLTDTLRRADCVLERLLFA